MESAKHVYFIGIGGIGISAVARMMLAEGKAVSGSDRSSSKVTDELAKLGAKIFTPQDAKNVPADVDCAVYTVAVPDDNPEMAEIRRRGIPLFSYPQTLDYISKKYYTIAVSGTHGKTTTTAMIAHILIEAGLDPTVIVGSLMRHPQNAGADSNFIMGKGKYLIVEADEYRKSFHNLHPSLLVVNNLDEDHLDFYKDLSDIQDSFAEVVRKLPKDGHLVTDAHNPHIAPLVKVAPCAVHDYKARPLDAVLRIGGAHNRSNAQAAATVAEILGVPKERIKRSLESFTGLWRRFEYIGMTEGGAKVYDDYAHNPQKVRAVLQGARELFPGKRIVAVFQPHLFSRTKLLFKAFVESFDEADEIILAPIYPAREAFDPTISSEMLAEALRQRGKDAISYSDFDDIVPALRKAGKLDADCVLLTIGAGEGDKISAALAVKKAA